MYTSAVLSFQAVINAGVDSVREHGLDGLGVRALAERLGVTPMALYRHVDTAAALESAVIEQVLAGVPPISGVETWDRGVRVWAAGARARLAAHPGVARHVLTRWFRLPQVLDWIEALLAASERSSMTGSAGVAAVNAVFTFVLMRVEAEDAIRNAGVLRRKLPRDKRRWPRLYANVAEYEVAQLDRHFEFGLDAILRGIERGQHGDT